MSEEPIQDRLLELQERLSVDENRIQPSDRSLIAETVNHLHKCWDKIASLEVQLFEIQERGMWDE